MDPKLFYKAEPRPAAVKTQYVSDHSLADFEGIPTPYGKRSKIVPGRLETYTEVINIGGSTGVVVHEQLGKSIVVLEGHGFLDVETTPCQTTEVKLSPGSFHYLKPGNGYAFRTVDAFMVLAVSQEAYYELELKAWDSPVAGIAPAFAARLPVNTSKAIEQSVLMASAEGRNLQIEVAGEDFNPLDAQYHGVNARPFLPPE
jgi:mannose-6-phosphate isomerase-like protein (cupin superfamily)